MAQDADADLRACASSPSTPLLPAVYHRHFYVTELGAGVAKVVDLRNTTVAMPEVEVQAVLLTFHIRNVRKCVRESKRILASRRILCRLIHQRAELLKYLEHTDRRRYERALERLASGLEPRTIQSELIVNPTPVASRIITTFSLLSSFRASRAANLGDSDPIRSFGRVCPSFVREYGHAAYHPYHPPQQSPCHSLCHAHRRAAPLARHP
ncbi:hypothetical protein BJV77DRAFT_719545 [Russula vinacea]|nr:hypothetical protein BJV77DRAFT_719545 [Russula vinacea]